MTRTITQHITNTQTLQKYYDKDYYTAHNQHTNPTEVLTRTITQHITNTPYRSIMTRTITQHIHQHTPYRNST